mmetsp:Transcript_39741/g.44773  ORF Transcript_39741/g.44773 Transcript_39741/m.44773 type:complete len:239 (+) Transcript_39741:486-1202(+)
MRAAAGPKTRIFSLDPLEKPICGQAARWIDDNPNTTYLVGDTFVDFGSVDWAGYSKRGELDPSTTLVYFDDHQNFFDRIVALQTHGFTHVLHEDNYAPGEGATRHDKRWTPKQLLGRSYDPDARYLFSILESYFEFPPLLPPAIARANTKPKKKQGAFLHHTNTNEELTEPLLRPEKNDGDAELFRRIARTLNLNTDFADDLTYQQFMNYCYIAYMEVLPMSPRLLPLWSRKDPPPAK